MLSAAHSCCALGLGALKPLLQLCQFDCSSWHMLHVTSSRFSLFCQSSLYSRCQETNASPPPPPPPRTHNRVVIVVQKIAAKNGIVAGRSYYFAEGWTEPCGSSGQSDKAKSQMHRGKTNLEFWWQKGDLYPSYTCTAWLEKERKTNSETEKMRTLRETGK